jgi:hypothetical protein
VGGGVGIGVARGVGVLVSLLRCAVKESYSAVQCSAARTHVQPLSSPLVFDTTCYTGGITFLTYAVGLPDVPRRPTITSPITISCVFSYPPTEAIGQLLLTCSCTLLRFCGIREGGLSSCPQVPEPRNQGTKEPKMHSLRLDLPYHSLGPVGTSPGAQEPRSPGAQESRSPGPLSRIMYHVSSIMYHKSRNQYSVTCLRCIAGRAAVSVEAHCTPHTPRYAVTLAQYGSGRSKKLPTVRRLSNLFNASAKKRSTIVQYAIRNVQCAMCNVCLPAISVRRRQCPV